MIFSRIAVDGQGHPTVNPGTCSLLVYTSDGADLYGFDTRLLVPGANQIAVRYVGTARPGCVTINGLGLGGCHPLGNKAATVPTDPPNWQTDWIGVNGELTGKVTACAHDACATYDRPASYECSDLYVHERNSGVHLDARPCTNPQVTLPV
ncbi:MAG TPA: hypothetical protein VM840_11875 [Actinomycetota bacterium]|nr:hypothetical protein [Actinomycetota bacterium]